MSGPHLKLCQAAFDVVIIVLLCCSAYGQNAVTTYHNDNYRTGSNSQEVNLTPSNVNVLMFGKLHAFPVEGYVYAQPLFVPRVNIGGMQHDVLYVADEHDAVTAFDVHTYAMLWQKSFLSDVGRYVVSTLSSDGDLNCDDLVPEIGITGTPVIDLSRNTLYVVARTKVTDTQTGQKEFYATLHAMDLRTGADKIRPQVITATVPGTGAGSQGGFLTFNAFAESQRPALLLVNGQIIVTFASQCDAGYYHGFVLSFDETNLQPTGAFATTPDGIQGGIWMSAGPPADSNGKIYIPTGNGDFTANVGGQDLGDSILRLNWSNDSFTLEDYFTPWDYQPLWDFDTDLGSGGVMLIPDQPGTTYPHLLVQAGKEGTIDLLNRDNMGHWHAGDDSQILQTIPHVLNGVWGTPAFWNNNVYFGGYSDYLKAFRFDSTAEQLSVGPVFQSPQFFNYPGPTPSVSSNGQNNGIVWIIQSDAFRRSGPAILRAYDADNLATELYDSDQSPVRDGAGPAVKFTPPTIANGLVFVAAQGEVDMYGLLHPLAQSVLQRLGSHPH